jgi:nitrite reductase/ring-hydroxylating ferredoxin subunit
MQSAEGVLQVYRLAALADLADLVPITLTVREREIAVVRVADEVYAFDAYCTHRTAPLADGAVTRNRTVLCPWHLGTFRLTDGSVVAGPPDTAIGSYPVVIRDGCAYLDDGGDTDAT